MIKTSEKTSRRKFLGAAAVTAGSAAAIAGMPLVAGKAVLAASTAGQHRWGFLIDLERCVGCKACAVACKTEFNVPIGVFRCSVKEHESGKYPNVTRDFVPWLCNHCENPVCVKDCPVDEVEATFTWNDHSTVTYKKRATYKRPDGIVLIDYDRCIGCGACVDLCPYKARFLNPVKKNADGDQIAEKCTLCTHRLNAGLVPACVNTCQAEARVVGELNDSDSDISKRLRNKKALTLIPEQGTDPQCHYIALNHEAYTHGRDTR